MDTRCRYSVMIVDDEPVNIRYIAEMLGEEYNILAFTSGDEAIDFLENSSEFPDLILLDIMMPGKDGYEVCGFVKQKEETHRIPVVFMTSLLSDSDEEKGFLVGASDYIKKPFSKIVAKSRIENQLKLKEYQDSLIESANTDQLTRLYNRKYFDVNIEKELVTLSRYRGYISLLMMDVDNFKAYNDNYGHLAGDECLKAVAKCIEASLERKNDFCARYGGEEFVVLLPGTDKEGAGKVANDILANIKNIAMKHEYSDVSSIVTISIGYTTIDEKSARDANHLVSIADEALYAAKKDGKNKAVFKLA